MTTDQAADILAAYQLTGSMSETGKIVGRHKSNVSRALKKAKVAVAPEPESLRNIKEKPDWIAAYSQRETALLGLVDKKQDDFRPRELIGAVKIIGDARYREEHPESVRGNVVNIDNRQITITDQVLTALREARKLP